MTETGSPARSAAASGFRTIRQSAPAKAAISELSCEVRGLTDRSPAALQDEIARM
jgi:hypothetical protein